MIDNGSNRVESFSAPGFFISSIGSSGSGNGQFSSPFGVAVSQTGLVYVSDSNNGRIEIFNSSGVFQSSFGTFGTGNGQFSNAKGVAVGTNGMVYVTDSGTNRVDRLFDPGSWVSGTNAFTDSTVGPTSVTVGSSQLLGTSLTMTSSMGLFVGGSVTVNSGGVLTQAGGSISAPTGITVNTGGLFSYQSGSLGIGAIAVQGGLFRAIQGGTLLNVGSVTVGTQSASELLLDGSVTMSATSVLVQGGLLAMGNSTLSVTGASPFHITGGEVRLQVDDESIINTSQMQLDGGLLDGSGQINAKLLNNAPGEVSVAATDLMTFTAAANTNNNLMSLTGGEFHFTQDLTNSTSGAIEGYGTLRVDGGLTNRGVLSLGGGEAASLFGPLTNISTFNLAGDSFIFGTANNQSGATIRISGTAPNVFYNAVTNNGTIHIDPGASAIFFGTVTGSGTTTNSGLGADSRPPAP